MDWIWRKEQMDEKGQIDESRRGLMVGLIGEEIK